MWITGMKGMKRMTAKYKVLRYIPNTGSHTAGLPAPVTVATRVSEVSQSALSPEETYTRQTYLNLSPEDKDYVRVFCVSNPSGAALVPRAKVAAGQVADHSLDCAAWASGNNKSQ